jgi:hypothetical protein
MKTFCSMLLVVFASLSLAAASFQIDGTPAWSITKPDCTLEVVGAIQNLSSPSTSSGYLKLSLWATLGAFPSAGKSVAEANLGFLVGGTQIRDFEDTVAADLSGLTGEYQFTLVLMEYIGGRWYNRVAIPAGKKNLDRGDFLDDATWNVRAGGFVAPPAHMETGRRLRLITMANSALTRITAGTEADLFLTFAENDEVDLRRGSTSGKASYTYERGRDSIRGKRFRTGRVSLYSNGVRDAEIVLFYRSTTKGTYRITGGGRIAWGNFIMR